MNTRIFRVLTTVAAVACSFQSMADSPTVLRYNRGFDDRSSGVASDSAGNLYVAGDVESADRKMEFAIIKYAANGTLAWTARYSNATHGTDAGHVNSVAIDAAGNVYAAGYVWKSVTPFIANLDWLVVSYAPDGSERWSNRINGTSDVWDQAGGVVVDTNGNAYVSGFIDDTATSSRAGWTLIKYSSAGSIVWRHTDVRSDGARDSLGALHFVPTGELVGVGGTSAHGVVTTKVDTNGNVVWRSRWEDSAVSDDLALDVDVDRSGNVYWTGETVATTNPELEHVPITVKYNAGGALQFVLRGDGAGGSSLGVDPFGDLIVSGASMREGGNIGVIATSKYDAAGNRKWLTPNVVGTVAIDSVGNVYAFDTLQSFDVTGRDLKTSKLNSDGVVQWEHRFNGQVSANFGTSDWAIAAITDVFDNLIAIGNSEDGSIRDIVTLRYAANVIPTQPPTSIAAPTGLLAGATSGRVTLTWVDHASNESAFSIERCVGKNCTAFAVLASVGANLSSYVDTSMARSTTYRYRVRATNGSVVSGYSNIATATTPKK